MSAGAIVFMVMSWAFVLGLATWAYSRVLRAQKHLDPDGTGPESPREPGHFAESGKPREDPR